jgi:hypothetical protein
MNEPQESQIGEHPTVRQAATLLGVDPARVRQWLKDGRLVEVEGSAPLRVEVASVLALRQARADLPRPPQVVSNKRKESDLVTDLRAEVSALRDKVETLAIEQGRREVLADVVERLQAERDEYLAALRQAENLVIELSSQRKKRLWRRS